MSCFKLNSDNLKTKSGQSRELSSETTNSIGFNTQRDEEDGGNSII